MSTKVGIQDIIDSFITKSELDKEKAETFAKAFFSIIEEGLEKDRYVKIKGFGTFKLVDVENRESINVNTGERFEIQGHTKITFTPENALRDLINKPFAHFETVILGDNVTFEEELKKEKEILPESKDVQKIKVELPKEPEIVQPESEILIKDEVTPSALENTVFEAEPVVQQEEKNTLAEPELQSEPEPIKEESFSSIYEKESMQSDQIVQDPVDNKFPRKKQKSNSSIYIVIIAAAVILLLIAILQLML